MDRFQFMEEVYDIVSDCNTPESVENRREEMIDIIMTQSATRIQFLNCMKTNK